MGSGFPELALMRSPIGEKRVTATIERTRRDQARPDPQPKQGSEGLRCRKTDAGRDLVSSFLSFNLSISPGWEQALAGNSSLVDPSRRDLDPRCLPRGRIRYRPQRVGRAPGYAAR